MVDDSENGRRHTMVASSLMLSFQCRFIQQMLRKRAQYDEMTECCDHQQVKRFCGAFVACFTSQLIPMSPSTQVKELQKLTKQFSQQVHMFSTVGVSRKANIS